MMTKAHASVFSVFIGLLALLFMGNSAIAQDTSAGKSVQTPEQAKQDAMGICPPINLLDEMGNVIDPVKNPAVNVPYSPKMTCGKCHDYNKITKGYHFLQGKGEKMTKDYAEAYPWARFPGQYGGRW